MEDYTNFLNKISDMKKELYQVQLELTSMKTSLKIVESDIEDIERIKR